VGPIPGDEESGLDLVGLSFVRYQGQGGADEFTSHRSAAGGKANAWARLLQETKGVCDLSVQHGPRCPGVELGKKRDRCIPWQNFDEDLGSGLLAPVRIEESGPSAGEELAVSLEESSH
jgi:hypothetical protein